MRLARCSGVTRLLCKNAIASSVFGGQANLLQAIDNIFTIYEPEIIAVHSTCLSETIGDDLGQIVAKAKDGLEDVKEGIEGAVEGLKNSFKK